ncbi:MAG: hypothetical protein WA869_09420, partial [Alloacidobacterium sp.]
ACTQDSARWSEPRHAQARTHPHVDGSFDPTWYRDSPHVAAFADEVCQLPVVLSKFEILDLDGHDFGPTQTTTDEHS